SLRQVTLDEYPPLRRPVAFVTRPARRQPDFARCRRPVLTQAEHQASISVFLQTYIVTASGHQQGFDVAGISAGALRKYLHEPLLFQSLLLGAFLKYDMRMPRHETGGHRAAVYRIETGE